MAELQGYAAKAAYGVASVWGTAVTLGDGDQVEYATEDITPEIALVESDQIVGEALSGQSDTGSISVQGSLSGMDAKYAGHERFLRAVFGSLSTSADGVGYKHQIDFALSNQGEFGTLAIEKVVTGPHEIDTWKPMELTIVGEPNNFVKLDVLGIGRQIRTKDPNRTNDASTAWTLPGTGAAPMTQRKVKFGQVTTLIDAVGTTPVTPFCLTGFTLNFVRNSDPVQTTCDGDYSSEPSTDTVEITGTFNFSIYDTDNDALVDAALAGDPMCALITFTHPDEYDSGKPYKWEIYLPGFQFNAGYPNVGGKGRVPVDFDFTVYNEEADPLDTDATMPRINVYNAVADPDDYTNS